MMVHVISVACGISRRKTRSFPVSLHANVLVEAEAFNLQTNSRFTTGTQNCCKSDWSFLFLPSLKETCNNFFLCVVEETHGSSGQCVSFSLIDVGSGFTAYVVFLFFLFLVSVDGIFTSSWVASKPSS